jgi:hypothetical protein
MKKIWLLVGIVVVVGIAGLVVVSFLARPGLLRARQAGNEVSARATLRTIASGQLSFSMGCGAEFFSPDLPTLGVTPPGVSEPFLPPDLTSAATITKAGYEITMGSSTGVDATAPASCNGVPPGKMVKGYWATATPMAPDMGTRAFAINTDGTLWYAEQQTPIRVSNVGPPAGATEYK